jgi:hypothetical protein
MVHKQRLERLEAALSPKRATLLWLEGFQRFETLATYTAWLLEHDRDQAPLVRVPRQALEAARRATKGQPPERVECGERQAVRDAAFLVQLVLHLNTVAHETLERGVLRVDGLHWRMRALAAEWLRAVARIGGDVPAATAAWDAWRADVPEAWIALEVEAEARRRLEERYLDGHPALLPRLGEDLATLREAMGLMLADCTDIRRYVDVGLPIEGVAEAPEPGLLLEGAQGRIEDRTRSLVDHARAEVLSGLEESEASIATMEPYVLRAAQAEMAAWSRAEER